MQLLERVVIVTGGGGGIGRAASLAFAREGAIVIVADIDDAAAETTAQLVRDHGGSALARHVDVRRAAEVARHVNEVVQLHGRLDVMVNNAGICRYGMLLDSADADYDDVVQVNQYGTYHGMLAAARCMRALGRAGVIINVGSVMAELPAPGVLAYAASKGAIASMTRAAALELAPHGIRVVCVAPGITETPLLRPVADAGLGRHFARRHMRNRPLVADEVAKLLVFLAGDGASGINGAVVAVDDGYSAFK